MKKKTVIITEAHEVWVIRSPESEILGSEIPEYKINDQQPNHEDLRTGQPSPLDREELSPLDREESAKEVPDDQ